MAGIFLEAGQADYSVVNSGDAVYGSTGTETVTIGSSATNIDVDANAEQVNFTGAITDYKFAQAGNILKVYATDGTTLVASVVTDGSSLVKFSTADAVNVTITDGVMSIANVALTSTATALTIDGGTGEVTADALNTLNTDNTLPIDGTAVTLLTGSATDVGTVLTAVGNSEIILSGSEAITLSDASVSAASVDSLAAATSGTVTATVVTTADEDATIATVSAISNVNASDVLTLEIAAGDVAAADAAALSTKIDTLTVTSNGNLVVKEADDSVTAVAASVVDSLAAATSGTVTATVTTGAALDMATTIANVDAADVITFEISDNTNIAAADLSALVTKVDTLTLTDSSADADGAYTVTGTTAISDYNALDALTDGVVTATVAAITGTTDTFVFNNNILTITNDFLNDTDQLSFVGAANTLEGTLAESAVDGSATNDITVDGSNTTVYVISSDALDLDSTTTTDDVISDFTSMTAVAAFLNPGFTTSNAAGETHFFVINDGSVDTASYVYEFEDDADNTNIDAAELVLIGTLTTDASAFTVDSVTVA